MPILTKLFSMEEAAQHNTKDDCWVVIDGKVYDVTPYLDEHPGGDDVLLTATGKDAQEEFEDAGHSQDARDLMEKFFIGELDPSASTIPEPKVSSKKQEQADPIPKIKDLSLLYWAAPVAIVGISVVVGFLYLRKK
uniref:Cytochrome b5 heme-binding domain-containing protein n=1 Tax=Opuntia streptacantha TaxID=393608 RepID=A0A7C9DYF6_OPUST